MKRIARTLAIVTLATAATAAMAADISVPSSTQQETPLSQEFPNDTLLRMDPRRLYFLTAHGVRVSHPGSPRGDFAAVRGQEANLDSLADYVNGVHDAQRKAAASERRLRAAVAALINEPIYYTVKRGDALFSIARKFDTTPEQIQQWNQLQGDRVKIGQRLLVKPAKK